VSWLAARNEATRQPFVQSMARTSRKIREMFDEWTVQVIAVEPPLPGFVLGDIPVVHADTKCGRYGFRDRLAIGDADLIIGPLTRRTAALMTSTGTRDTTLRVKKQVQVINALFWRAARAEVACHPEDVVESRRVFAHLGDLRPSRLLRG